MKKKVSENPNDYKKAIELFEDSAIQKILGEG